MSAKMEKINNEISYIHMKMKPKSGKTKVNINFSCFISHTQRL